MRPINHHFSGCTQAEVKAFNQSGRVNSTPPSIPQWDPKTIPPSFIAIRLVACVDTRKRKSQVQLTRQTAKIVKQSICSWHRQRKLLFAQ